MQSEGVARCVTMHAGCIVQPLQVDFVIPMPELRFDPGVPDVHAIVSDAIFNDLTYFNKTSYAATCPKTCSGLPSALSETTLSMRRVSLRSGGQVV